MSMTDAWRRLVHNLRCLCAERLLHWALDLTPAGTDEELAMCLAIQKYSEMISPSCGGRITRVVVDPEKIVDRNLFHISEPGES